jgi:hypothetical protein
MMVEHSLLVKSAVAGVPSAQTTIAVEREKMMRVMDGAGADHHKAYGISSLRRRMTVAAYLILVLALFNHRADADAVESPLPHVYRGRDMTERELRDFASSDTEREFVIADVATGETGHLTVSKGSVHISWYFTGNARVAVLDRFGQASICIRRGDKPTKCIVMLSDPHSDSCRYLIREIHDERRACMREIAR